MSTVYLSAASAHERRGGRGRPGATGPLCVAGLCLAALALTWVVAALVPATHYKDAVALYRFTLLGGPRLDEIARALLALLEPIAYTVWAIVLVVIALRRRGPQLALAVALVLACAPLIAEALKPLLAHPHAFVGDTSVGAASWPSGHATAATVLVLCAVLVVPERLRPAVAAFGLLFMAAIGFSLVMLAWHLPSDVLGGYLLGTFCTALALAWVRSAEPRSLGAHRSP
jgi:membrane-associated phospholipid phosphatase